MLIIAFDNHLLSFLDFFLIKVLQKNNFLLLVKKIYLNTMSLCFPNPTGKEESLATRAKARA